MDDSEVVKCELKGHDVVRERGQTKCLTEGGKILKDRSLLGKMRYGIMDTDDEIFDSFTIGLLVISAMPLIGWIAPSTSLLFREDLPKESTTVLHYGFPLSVLSNLILLIFLIYS